MSNPSHHGGSPTSTTSSFAKGNTTSSASFQGRRSQSLNNNETQRRIIFPSLYPKPLTDVRYYGSKAQQQQQQQQQLQLQQKQIAATNSCTHKAEAHTLHLKPELERSISFPKNGLKHESQHHQNIKRVEMLPLPELPKLKSRPSVNNNNEKRGMRIHDSICIRKAALPDVSAAPDGDGDVGHATTLLSGRKWVVQSPQIDSLSLEKQTANAQSQSRSISHRTYYPAASVPCYHEPVTNDVTPKKPLPSILRSTSNESLGNASRRSSILFRKSSTIPLSPDVTLSPNQPHSTPSTSCLTLASPTSIRSLNSELDTGERDNIGETEADLNRITVPPKVIPRQDNKLRRNASDTVVIKSEEEIQQRRRKSIHLEDKTKVLEEGVTRHESLECLPNHKRISFDPHIWVYEYKDDRHEFFDVGGKWFSECELDRFKEDAIQRIRQRNSKMISAGQGRIALVPAPQDRGQNASPTPIGQRPVVFTHPALGTEEEYDPEAPSSKCDKSTKESMIQDALSREMRNVLVVDPHDVFLNLFTKCLKYIIPHVSVATARSGEEALAR